MLSKLLCLLFVSAVCATVTCSRKVYSGYPCCKKLIDDRVSDTVSCESAQATLAKEGKYCPDPHFKAPDDLSKDAMQPWPAGAPKGHVNFLVYRAATLGDHYATILENSNAADRAGVLSYLHSEVVPQDMRYKNDTDLHRRKFGIDSIMVFNVTVYNPKPWMTPDIPLSPYVAFDKGQCDEKIKACQNYKTLGYQVGYQVQAGNPRANYSAGTTSDYWYSFPKGGLCDNPNGTETCTYNYNLVGRISIDEMIHLDRLGYKNYYDFDKAGNIEFERAGRDLIGACKTTGGIDFWRDPCDLIQSYGRIQAMMNTKIRPLDDTKFYNMTQDCSAGESGGKLTTGEIIAIAAGGCVVLGIFAYAVSYVMKSKKTAEKQPLMGGGATA